METPPRGSPASSVGPPAGGTSRGRGGSSQGAANGNAAADLDAADRRLSTGTTMMNAASRGSSSPGVNFTPQASEMGTPGGPLGTPGTPGFSGGVRGSMGTTPRTPGGGLSQEQQFATPSRQRRDLAGSMGLNRPQRRRRRQSLGSSQQRQAPSRSDTPHGTPGRPPAPAAMPEPATPGAMGGAFENDGGETFVWGTNVSVQRVTSKFMDFMRNFRDADEELDAKYTRLLDELIEREGDTLNIDASNIHQFDPHLYRLLLRYPLEVIPIFDIIIADMALERTPTWSKHIQVRTFNLRQTMHMRDLNPSDIDQLVAIKGMVIRASSIIPDIKAAFFKCKICGHSPDLVFVDRGRIEEPQRCPRPECAARNSMQIVHNRCVFINKQIVRLQETPESIPEGETPHTVSVCLFDSLVDTAKPGDRVEITGVFRAIPVRVASTQRNLRSLYKTYLDCIHIKKSDASRLASENSFGGELPAGVGGEGSSLPQQMQARVEKLRELSQQPDIYEKLTRSIAPSIYELDDIKKGLLCQLFGGSVKHLANGAQIRGDINVLLVGDPGTSKSQLLQYVHKIAPRGIYTSGRGSSAVGLTAYVTQDPETREMVLESGALVLSDQGICCIDEFDKMSDSARSMLHEVMEQQTVSVAKAGIIATLNARTSVLACANPRESRYNPRLSVIDNIQLPPTLLSRFDLIYLVLDKADEQMDRRLARHLVALHYEEPESRVQDTLDSATLAAYISHARNEVQPQLTDAAAEDLVNSYVELRGRGMGRKVITATPRQLESLIRISEALARMRFSDLVERQDVAEARRLLDVAMQQSATDPTTGTIDMDLITTGVSASERTKRTQIADAVLSLLNERLPSAQSMRAPQVFDEIKRQTAMPITVQEIRDALSRLQGEGKITFHDDVVRSL